MDQVLSMMPEGMLEQLTAEQRRDLIAYLRSPAGVELHSLSAPIGQ
ncbi:hypothetical protein RMSM_05136 [Rhodopirellula maiorica SM1]|uniref:Uncharacterized protein n=1 Tax=Rhodopirellula maiorica SM1 TaxID=1265738 RepID=M5RVF0_9BACT|nr:hypothetical protein [Rhodopirellula maiorica]EMI17934.1 hypothetical protein RMSM_05136 [Rhodopirellula maiorica SM1]